MVPDPLQALSRSLHLGEVVVPPPLGPHDGGNHGGHVHQLPVRHCGHPAGGPAVDVGAPHRRGPGPHADKGRVPAAAEDRRTRAQAQFRRRALRQTAAHPVCRADNRRQVITLYIK